jgi:oligoribonuclease NrnB/cAMP/cGMP phosphodiesterase (DHH superfamily)
MNIIYYHNADFDGKASGAVVYNALKGNVSIYLRGIDYGTYDFDEEIQRWTEEDTVYLVDFSFQGNMEKAHKILGDRLIFIDHHKTAIEEIEGLDIKGLREVGKAACRLCWSYFYPDTPEPEAVKLIGMYDVWDLNEKVEDFQLGVGLLDLDPDSANWKTLFKSDETLIENICEKGKVIGKYLSIKNEEFAKKNGFEIDIEGYRAVCLNSSHGSKPFDSIFDSEEHDIMLAFSKTKEPNIWKVSFYSEDNGPDVSEIAKNLGGGGHRNASGCEIKTSKLMGILNNNEI